MFAYAVHEGITYHKPKKARVRLTIEGFHKWASSELRSPRAKWLYSVAFSFGTMLIVWRAAMRYVLLKHLIPSVISWVNSR